MLNTSKFGDPISTFTLHLSMGSYEVSVAREFVDGWHIVTFEEYGYLHDVGFEIINDMISGDAEATSLEQFERELAAQYERINTCWELHNSDWAYAHKRY